MNIPSLQATVSAEEWQLRCGLGGAFVWPSLIRKLERLNTAYRT